MKRLSILLLAAILAVASGWAIPALKGGRSVKQPDGTSVTIRLHGDEYLHYQTTDDGYPADFVYTCGSSLPRLGYEGLMTFSKMYSE